MKIRTLLRYSFIALCILGIADFCEDLLQESLAYPAETTDGFIEGIYTLGVLTFVVYQGRQDKYGSVQAIPSEWLFLFMLSGSLLSTMGLYNFIQYWSEYLPYVIKKAHLSGYLLFAQLGILTGAIGAAPFFMTYRTAQALRHKLS